ELRPALSDHRHAAHSRGHHGQQRGLRMPVPGTGGIGSGLLLSRSSPGGRPPIVRRERGSAPEPTPHPRPAPPSYVAASPATTAILTRSWYRGAPRPPCRDPWSEARIRSSSVSSARHGP